MYESRAYDNEHGDPVVVLVVTGTHDVSRLVHVMAGGPAVVEQLVASEMIQRQVRRHNGGRSALKLLRDHGGADFTAKPAAEAEIRQLREVIDQAADRLALAEATLARVTKATTYLIDGHWYISADDLRKLPLLGSYVPEEVAAP
jgi:hypothetical protein